MRPLRFCMITTFYPPYSFGGDGVVVFSLANKLARRGHRVDVIYDTDAYKLLAASEPRKNVQNEPGVHLHPLKSWAGPLSPLATQQTGQPLFKRKKIEAILNECKPDVIHYHNISLVGGPGLLFLGDAVKLYSIHEHWLVCPMHVLWKFDREICAERSCLACQLRGGRPPQWWRYSGLLERAVREVDQFLCPTEFAADRHVNWGGLELSIQPFVFHSDWKSADDVRAEVNSVGEKSVHDRPFFLMVGRHEKIKGFQNVIPIFERPENTDLLIAGEGDYTPVLKDRARGFDRVRFLGHIDEETLARYYRDALALIIPSICYEVFPLVLLEALASRIPVIAHDVGPLAEVIEESGGGLVYKTEDELVAAMALLQDAPDERSRIAETGHRHYQRNWAEQVGLNRYLDIVAEQIDKKSAKVIELQKSRFDGASDTKAPPSAGG